MKKKILFSIVILFSAISICAAGELSVETVNQEVDSRVQIAMSNADYMVTAGDIYTLGFIAGSSTMEYHIMVDSTYKVRVANLAVIDAAGKSYMTLKRQVEDIVSKNYPMSGVQFSLVSPASFNVIIKGEVTSTSERSAWALSRLSSVVNPVKTGYASIRDITVTSTNGVTKHYDLFKASREGDLSQDPYLRPGDVITLKKFHKQVGISGAVRRPGTYELLEDENLKDLIDVYADGFSERADVKRITVTRIIDGSEKPGSVIYLDYPKQVSNFVLNSFDSVFIDSLVASRPVMYMEGAILKQNSDIEENATEVESATRITVPFDYDENYVFFLRAKRSYFESAIADIQNAFIVRGEELIPIDISRVLYDSNFTSELVVQPGDLLRVPMKQFFVSVSGAVQKPGRYPYIPNKTYDYYIGLAGGFNKTMNAGKSVDIIDSDGRKLNKKSEITPETTITADTNSFLFYFNQYAPVITTIVSVIATSLSIMAATGVLK
ncbi:SLBB domain-containing protein [Treponema bryantii]|uniref:SLBB domain-containing protein n=1 Tax=Treponema bryantii TaxID=163 RepID=UPI002B2D8609|nr:hypothetical protein TRBR_07350 [Treponema bryantii]